MDNINICLKIQFCEAFNKQVTWGNWMFPAWNKFKQWTKMSNILPAVKMQFRIVYFYNVHKVEWRVSSLKIFIWTFVYSFYLHCVPSLISQSWENQFLFVWQTNVGCWRATEVKLHQILWWYCFQLFNHHKVEAFQPNLFTLLWIINSKEGVSSTFLFCFLPGSSVFS